MRTKLFILICGFQLLGISQVLAQEEFYQLCWELPGNLPQNVTWYSENKVLCSDLLVQEDGS